MNPAEYKCSLARAVVRLLPGAEVVARQQRAWHSATFAGETVLLALRLDASDGAARVAEFAKKLPEAEFNLPRQLVADIEVRDWRLEDGALMIDVAALLVDE